MQLTSRQQALLEFVKEQHGDQVRKYTGEPYWTHPMAVAELIPEREFLEIEVALCHDLFEDTDCDSILLFKQLQKCGYNSTDSSVICLFVDGLTNKFTKEAYPEISRKERKKAETERLYMQGYDVHTVKYADILHNTPSIVENDPDFAKIYLAEKVAFLRKPYRGNPILHKMCYTMILNYMK